MPFAATPCLILLAKVENRYFWALGLLTHPFSALAPKQLTFS